MYSSQMNLIISLRPYYNVPTVMTHAWKAQFAHTLEWAP
jgi:hypothetical protein